MAGSSALLLPADEEGRQTVAARADTLPKRRPLSFALHSLFGLKVSLFLAFVCLTGTIATVAHEIEWLYKPEIRASAPAPRDADWGAMWGAAQAAFPDAKIAGIGPYDRTDAAYFVKSVHATDAGGTDFTIYVDPATARVTGHEYGRSFQDYMRGLHYYLFLPGDWGFYLVVALGPVLLLSLVTGLFVYKKFWRGFLRRPRLHRGLRTAAGDLHRLVGLWSLWFVAIIALTSVYYLVERAGLDFASTPPAAAPLSAEARGPSAGQVGRWAALARAEKPGFAITGISLPYEPGEPVTVQGHWRAVLVRERADRVYIDPVSDRVLGVRTAHEMGAGERLLETVDPLHFGTFGGLVTRLIWVLFGLGLTALAVTGAIIYAKRTRQVLRGGVSLPALDFLGPFKWPSVVLTSLVPLIAALFW
ncbi:PepSY-associated TM helix domain-containing protein [Qipengyuania sediminis]|uniref:PepSY-associated TM helix domain-containing protein n=1 Tax=Qipengyuania sediminis TaxID=1532023 RepID=UPI0010594078|nr:PepSY-associated TM helix domain-containing protein [Qipengyuania sediminis]